MTRKAGSEDADLLIDVLRRSPLLFALRDDRLDRGEIQDRLGISRATCHRHTRLLADVGTIERVDGRFGLTEPGELLADAIDRFEREAGAALRLAPVLDAVRAAPVDVDPEAFAGATVTSAERGDPYSPVARFVDLVRETETLRGIDVDAIAPLYLEEVKRRIVDGMETVDVTDPDAAEEALDAYPEKCREACVSGNLTIQLHDDLPFALVLLDERVGIGVGEGESRNLRAFVDTDSPAVREWAEAVYQAYEAEAVPLPEFTRRGFREATDAGASTG